MSKQISIQDSVSLVPSGYDSSNSSYSSVSSSYPISNGYDGSDSNNYAYITCTTGSRVSSYISYTFNVSDVPANATIDSITCSAKTRVSSTSYLTSSTIQLYSGSTAKGSSTSADSTSATARSITSTGTWTRAELDNIEIRLTGTRGTSSTNRAAYLYFYGADLTINYSVTGTAYTITASSNVQDVTVSPATQDIFSGEDGIVRIDAPSIDDIEVTDNGTDVTNSLVRHNIETGGTEDTVLGEYTLVSGGFNGSGATYFSGIVGHSHEASQTTSNYYSSGSGTIAVFTYDMAITNIPSNATITRCYALVNGHAESTSNSNEYMCAQIVYGSSNTALSNELNFKSIGTSNTTQTIEATTLPTVAQCSTLKLQCRLGYYGGAINGATLYVVYTVPASGNQYYWTYTISNISIDHIVSVDTAGIYIPPEEDPTKTYYSLTISSINATTNPSSGTTRLEAGTNQTVTITPSDPQLTLALDNGVDITSQLVGGVPTNTYTVTTQVSGASYGFTLNSNTGYYVSTNDGVSSSASVARVNFDLESDVLVTIQYINQGESQADYGMFGKIDTTVSTTGNTYDSSSASPDDPNNYYYICASASDSSTSVKTLTYNISSGQHYIDIKYAKDQASDSGNDSLQWKILSIEATSAGGDYTYTLNNISQKHSLIFIFGEVTYYFVTSSCSGGRIFPDGQMVKLPGDSYTINIVPNNITSTVTITDNGTIQTSNLERFDGYDKEGNPAVSYSYHISNVSAAHTLVIQCGDAVTVLWFKDNGNWVAATAVYKKVNGSWVEQASSTWSSLFNTSTNYVKGN